MTGSGGGGDEDALELACGDVEVPGVLPVLVEADADGEADDDAVADDDTCGVELDEDVTPVDG